MDTALDNEMKDMNDALMGLVFLCKVLTRDEIVYLSEDAPEYLAYAASAQTIDAANKLKPLFAPLFTTPDNLEGTTE